MAVAYVTTATGIDTYDGTTGTTQATASWNLANTNRLIVVGIRWASSASGISISGVADTAGNTYVDSGVGRLTMASSVGYVQMYYCKATTATNANNVVTVTFSSATDYKSVIAAEYSGADTSAPLDVTASGTNASATSVTSGSFTPTRTGDVAVAVVGHGPAETDVISAGASYTSRAVTQANGGDHLFVEDRLLAPTSSQTASASNGGASFWWGAIVATFKTAGISLLTSTSVASTGGAGGAVTTSGIDTTGASLIVAFLNSYTGISSAATVTDSKSNTWTALTARSGADFKGQLFYTVPTSVGAAHTFSNAVNQTYSVLCVLVFVNTAASSPFEAESGTTNLTSTTIQPGSLTPAADNELVVLGVGARGEPTNSNDVSSVDSSFVLQEHKAGVTNNNLPAGIAYRIQTTATASNPTGTLTNSDSNDAAQAIFKAVASGGGAAAVLAAFVLPLLGVQ